MKKITALLTALMMCMTFGANFVYAADSNSARNAVLQIRKEIDSHKSNIQSKNGELFKLTPEEIAEADFKVFGKAVSVGGKTVHFSVFDAYGVYAFGRISVKKRYDVFLVRLGNVEAVVIAP